MKYIPQPSLSLPCRSIKAQKIASDHRVDLGDHGGKTHASPSDDLRNTWGAESTHGIEI